MILPGEFVDNHMARPLTREEEGEEIQPERICMACGKDAVDPDCTAPGYCFVCMSDNDHVEHAAKDIKRELERAENVLTDILVLDLNDRELAAKVDVVLRTHRSILEELKALGG